MNGRLRGESGSGGVCRQESINVAVKYPKKKKVVFVSAPGRGSEESPTAEGSAESFNQSINQNPQRATHEHARSHIRAQPHGQQTGLTRSVPCACVLVSPLHINRVNAKPPPRKDNAGTPYVGGLTRYIYTHIYIYIYTYICIYLYTYIFTYMCILLQLCI